ncbi:MAG: Hpt domain-containing protein [Acidobacteriaceae bacterium]
MSETPANEGASPPAETAAEKMAKMLALLWQKNKPTIAERVTLLRQSYTQLVSAGSLDPQQQAAAASAAHKLAGVLGSFGFPQGTDAARHIEWMLESGEPGPVETEKFLGWLQELEQLLAAN